MTLHDPLKAYSPSSNIEAHFVCGVLHDAGIEAVVVEDVSDSGVDVQKPQVWINRSDMKRARPVLSEYDRAISERRAATSDARVACRSGLSSFGFWSLLVGSVAAMIVSRGCG